MNYHRRAEQIINGQRIMGNMAKELQRLYPDGRWVGDEYIIPIKREKQMKPVYQITGAKRGENGDCFQACLASVLGKRLADVPNFMDGLRNGQPMPQASVEFMASWLKGVGCDGYVEFGFPTSLSFVLQEVNRQAPGSYFLLTGCTAEGMVHTVVCKGNRIVHDPATSAGHTVLVRNCPDGHFRTGFILREVG